jgi:hypothetical protein
MLGMLIRDFHLRTPWVVMRRCSKHEDAKVHAPPCPECGADALGYIAKPFKTLAELKAYVTGLEDAPPQ